MREIQGKSILVRGSEGSSYRESTVIESTKKTREEMWREASAVSGTGEPDKMVPDLWKNQTEEGFPSGLQF